MTRKVEIEVSKELSELAEAVANFLVVLKAAAVDGFDFTDIPDVVASAMSDLLPGLEGSDKIAKEFFQDPEAFIAASSYGVGKIIAAILANGKAE